MLFCFPPEVISIVGPNLTPGLHNFPALTVDTRNPAYPYYPISLYFPRYQVLGVIQNFYYTAKE